MVRHGFHCRHHLGGVQQRLGRNTADVEADPAQRWIALHQHRLHAQIGGPERSGIAARPGAEHHHLGMNVAALGHIARTRRGSRGARRRRLTRAPVSAVASCAHPLVFGFRGLRRGRLGRLQRGDHRALGDAVTDRNVHLRNLARVGARHVHRRLVAFQRDERLLDVHRVAAVDEHLDDLHVLEVTDVGNFYFDVLGHWEWSLTDGPEFKLRNSGESLDPNIEDR